MKRNAILLTSIMTLVLTGCGLAAEPVDPATTWTLAEGRWETYLTEDGLPHNHIEALTIDPDGRLWVATERGGGIFDGNTWTTIVGSPVGVMDITFDEQARVWMADGRGVDVYDGTALTTYSYDEGLASVQSRSIIADDQGNIWVGFNTGSDASGGSGGGIDVFKNEQWHHFSTADGLFGNNVFDLAKDDANTIWAVGEQGISWFNGEVWETMTLPDQSVSQAINCVAFDPSGRAWFGTRRLGLWIWDGEAWTQITSDDGLAGDSVWAIAFDGAGRAWLGTSSGLSILDGETWTTYTIEDGLAYNDVRALAFADDGVWVGTWRGLSHLVFDGETELSTD